MARRTRDDRSSALDSKECQREKNLAEDLGKPIIVVILRGLTTDDPRLARWADTQFVDLSAESTERMEPFEHDGKVQRVPFNLAALASIKARLVHLGIAPGSFAWAPKGNAGPYPGLAAFGVEDAGIFFGRDAEIMTGQTKLRQLRKRRQRWRRQLDMPDCPLPASRNPSLRHAMPAEAAKPTNSAPISLATLDLLKGVQPATLDELQRQIQRRRLDKGEMLFNVGDASTGLYIVVEGRVRIWTVSAAGAEVTLNVLPDGALFGEIGMLDGGIRTAGASAMTTTDLISLSRRSFFDALERDAQLARNVIAFLCLRLRWVSARMEDAALRQAPQRLARMLGFLARDHGKTTPEGIEIGIKLTQSELAQWAAMSRESLNKLLVRWASDGMLTQTRGNLTVHQLERLDEIAEYGE